MDFIHDSNHLAYCDVCGLEKLGVITDEDSVNVCADCRKELEVANNAK